MSITELTELGTAPDPTDEDTFDDRAETTVQNLAQAIQDYNANVAGFNAGIASAANAIAAANATVWTSGEAFTQQNVDDGVGRYSPTDFQSYRLTTPLTDLQNVTDPAADTSGNWVKLSAAPEVGEKAFTFTGAASAGDPVVLNSDGTVSAVTETADGTFSNVLPSFFQADYAGHPSVEFNQDTGFGIAVYEPNSQNQTDYFFTNHQVFITGFRIGDDGRPVSTGQCLLPGVGAYDRAGVCVHPDPSKGFLVFLNGDPATSEFAKCHEIRQDPVTGAVGWGGSIEFASNTYQPAGNVFQAASGGGSAIVFWMSAATDDCAYATFYLDSNGDLALGESQNQLNAWSPSNMGRACYDPGSDCFNIGMKNGASTSARALYKVAVDPSDGTTTERSVSVPSSSSSNVGCMDCLYHADVGKPYMIWNIQGNQEFYTPINNGAAATDTPTLGTAATFEAGNDIAQGAQDRRRPFSIPKPGAAFICVHGNDEANSTDAWMGAQLSGDTLTVTRTELTTNNTNYANSGFGTDMGVGVFCYVLSNRSYESSHAMSVYMTHSTNLTEENFIGFAQEAATDGQSKKVTIEGGIITGLSGLTPGKDIFVRPDGSIGHTRKDRGVRVGTALTATTAIVRRGNSL